ncbi:MAG: hypothetical protein QOH81_2897 [Sphingomonadales bacterium]|jgi:glycosyltransferase involved in cell wall biosynthesis|nr:hypothetical protein [Sphingomonadales bacterium]
MATAERDRFVTTASTVSVVIPTCNRSTQTQAAVDSALAQTFRPCEVIVVDDGSAKPVSISCPGVRVLRHRERRGAAAARNTGIDAATGAWVPFLDSDDRWRADKLERQFARLGPLSREGALCCCNVLVFHSRGEAGRPHNSKAPSGDLSEWILVHGNTAQTSGIMLPTAAARRIRFDESLERHEDWDFFLRAAAEGLAISYVGDPLVLFDNSARPDRISSGAAPVDVLNWIDRSAGGSLVSARARHDLLCMLVVAPGFRARPVAAFRSIAVGILRGRLRPGMTMRWLARSLIRRRQRRRGTPMRGEKRVQ